MPLAYDWSAFDVHLAIRAPPAALFRAWATGAGLSSFFMKSAVFSSKAGPRAPDEPAQVGDTYRWTFIHGPTLEGRVLAIEPDRAVSFTFGDNVVDVDFAPRGEGVLLHLRQRNIARTPEEQVASHLGCRTAWAHFMTVLKGVLEHGIDVRDTDPETAGSFAALYRPPSR